MAARQEGPSLDQLSVQELSEVRQQLEQEVNSLRQSAVALQETATKFANAGQAIEHLQGQEQGQPVLLPLTESLYISGAMESVEKVLIDIGTGYFVEHDLDAGVDYCKRKVNLVREKVEQLYQLMQQRRAGLQQVSMMLAEKVQASGGAA